MIVSVNNCSRATQECKIDYPIPPVGFSLRYIQGHPDESSLFILQLYNPYAKQTSIRNIARPDSNKPAKESPYKVHITKDFWHNKLYFVIDEGNNSHRRFKDKIAPVKYPKETGLVLGPDDVHKVVYKTSSKALPPAGTKIHVAGDIGKYHIVSNSIKIQEPCKSDYEKLLREGFVQWHLEEYKGLLKISEDLILINPSSYDGYLYKGLALEKIGKYREALNAYQLAVGNLPPSNNDVHNYPAMLHMAVDRVREKINAD